MEKNIYSWIHIDDLVSSIIFLIENNCKGVYNLVAPNPVTSKQFTLTISKILGKKIIIHRLYRLKLSNFSQVQCLNYYCLAKMSARKKLNLMDLNLNTLIWI